MNAPPAPPPLKIPPHFNDRETVQKNIDIEDDISDDTLFAIILFLADKRR